MNYKKATFLKASYLLIFSFLLLSCECSRIAKGTIRDADTHLPIDSVKVTGLELVYYEVFSDSTGQYFMPSGMVGAVGGCPDLKISFSKEGYKTSVVTNPAENTIYLKAE